MLVGLSKWLKQIIQIPTGRKQTSWLFTSMAEDLNWGLPRTNSASGQSGTWTRGFRIKCFHSRGRHLCKFNGTKESVFIRKESNSQRTGLGHKHGRRFIVLGHQHGRRFIVLGHQHGRRFIVLGHQYGRRDVMWKHSIDHSRKYHNIP